MYDLADEISQILLTEITRAIDQEFIIELLKSSGWYKQIVDPVTPISTVIDWVNENIQYEYKQFDNIFLFKNIDDFVAFTLRFA